MKISVFRIAALAAGVLLGAASAMAQPSNPASTSAASSAATVPMLINYSGVIRDSNEKSSARVTGVTFLLYPDQLGGSPLWMETQNIAPDKLGRYTVTLGATRSEGLPAEMFASGQARWLAVQVAGQPEQPRVLLVAVPYALKAVDAQTLGGLPPSAFVLAAPVNRGDTPAPPVGSSLAPSNGAPPPVSNVTTSGGTVNTLPLWTAATDVESSAITQAGSGATAKIGINTAAPVGTLDVKGSAFVRGLFNLPATGTATSTAGKNSQPAAFTASVFSSATSTAVNQSFRLQAEPAGNNSATASSTLNLLFAQGAATPAETGLKVAANGQITFASGQAFPGTGTVKSVALSAPASDFSVSGSPVTGTGTLGLAWKVAPTNANTVNAIVKRDSTGSFNANNITTSGTITSSTSNPFAILATTSSGTGAAIEANNTATSGLAYGVYGTTASSDFNAVGVYGAATNSLSTTYTFGVEGRSNSQSGIGVFGFGTNTSQSFENFIGGIQVGVWGDNSADYSAALLGTADHGSAIMGENNSVTRATAVLVNNATSAWILQTYGNAGTCGIETFGDLACSGTITAGAKFSRIDHPLDPANKYLVHTAIDSPEMKTVYDGVTSLDSNGEAWVTLPAYVEALNGNFRYQLTAIGAPGPNLYVAEKISGNRFRIAGGKPGAEVSWQVTGIRSDAWTKAHPQEVEPEKPAEERGYYLHPEAFGQPHEKGLAALHNSQQKAGMQPHPHSVRTVLP